MVTKVTSSTDCVRTLHLLSEQLNQRDTYDQFLSRIGFRKSAQNLTEEQLIRELMEHFEIDSEIAPPPYNFYPLFFRSWRHLTRRGKQLLGNATQLVTFREPLQLQIDFINLARIINFRVYDETCSLVNFFSHRETLLEKCIQYWILYNPEKIQEYQEYVEYQDRLYAQTRSRYQTTTTTTTHGSDWTEY